MHKKARIVNCTLTGKVEGAGRRLMNIEYELLNSDDPQDEILLTGEVQVVETASRDHVISAIAEDAYRKYFRHQASQSADWQSLIGQVVDIEHRHEIDAIKQLQEKMNTRTRTR